MSDDRKKPERRPFKIDPLLFDHMKTFWPPQGHLNCRSAIIPMGQIESYGQLMAERIAEHITPWTPGHTVIDADDAIRSSDGHAYRPMAMHPDELRGHLEAAALTADLVLARIKKEAHQ